MITEIFPYDFLLTGRNEAPTKIDLLKAEQINDEYFINGVKVAYLSEGKTYFMNENNEIGYTLNY